MFKHAGVDLAVRQIFVKQKDEGASLVRIVERPLLSEIKGSCLIRKHEKPTESVFEDWLDYRRDSIVY